MTKVVPVVVGAWGSVSKKMAGHLENKNDAKEQEQEQCKSRHSSDRHMYPEKCWKSEEERRGLRQDNLMVTSKNLLCTFEIRINLSQRN